MGLVESKGRPRWKGRVWLLYDMWRWNHLVYSSFKVTLVCFTLTASLACLLFIQGWTSVVCVKNKVPYLLAVGLGRYITSGNILLIVYSTALFLMNVLLGRVVQLASGSTVWKVSGVFFPSFRCCLPALYDKFSTKLWALARFAVLINGIKPSTTFLEKTATQAMVPNQSLHYVYAQPQKLLLKSNFSSFPKLGTIFWNPENVRKKKYGTGIWKKAEEI